MSANRSDNSQGDTGTVDIIYDLISTSYHLLQGAETVAVYIADARQQGDEELVSFFTETKDDYQRRAERAKQLLQARMGQQSSGAAG